MLRKISLVNPWHQYLIGAGINLAALLILYSFDMSRTNLLSHQLAVLDDDVARYISISKNFLEYGVFGDGLVPNSFRTIGYPMVISVFIFLFKDNWELTLQIVQCLLLAGIYPVSTLLLKKLFSKDADHAYLKYVFLFIVASGFVFAQSFRIATDLIFAALLYWSLLLGFLCYEKKNVFVTLLYILVVAAASIVRPTNTFFPLINILIALFVRQNFPVHFAGVKKILIVTVALFMSCSLPSVRNYMNYSSFVPSNSFAYSLIQYYSREIAHIEGGKAEDELFVYTTEVFADKNLSKQNKLAAHYTFKMMSDYPASAMKAFVHESEHVLLGNYVLMYMAPYFNAGIFESRNSNRNQKTNVILYGSYALALMYAILWLILLVALTDFYKRKDYLLLLLIIFIFLFYIAPGLISGWGCVRYRSPFELFLIALPIRYLYFNRTFFFQKKS